MKKLNKIIIALSLISSVLCGTAQAQEINISLADVNDEVTVSVTDKYATYALLGFESFPFLIDISDEYTPLVVEGYEVLQAENSEGFGVYFNYNGDAVIHAIGFDSIIDITSI